MSENTIENFEAALLCVTGEAMRAAVETCGGGCNAGDLLIVAAVRAYCVEHGDTPRDVAFQEAWKNYAAEVMADQEFGGMNYGAAPANP